jgi:hypothetical protein
VTAVPAPSVRWMTSAPLWTGAAREAAERDDRAVLQRPALLRFASDDFMDELAADLAAGPGRLSARVARPEGHRERPPGAPPGWTPQTDRLTLYLPAHGHFNLVVASLVCRRPGLPDHTVHPEHDERVGFLLRRTDPAAGAGRRELAWVPRARTTGGPVGWLPVPDGAEGTVPPGEEILPLFPVTYRDGDVSRRLLAGLVPTVSGEVAPAAPDRAIPAPDTPPDAAARPDQDPRWEELDRTVVIPTRTLTNPNVPVPWTDDDLADASAFILLDLADLLARQASAVWTAVLSAGRPPAGPDRQLYDALGASVDTAGGLTWREALTRVWAEAPAITGEAEGPVSVRVNITRSALVAQTPTAGPAGDPPGTASLQGLVRAVLPPADAASKPDAPPTTTALPKIALPKIELTGRARYCVRCVYQRPHCAPWSADLVGERSEEFGIAAFFDPDAPARDIRIALPLATGLKDLRKHRKGVGMMISDQLRGQMGRITDLKKATDGKIGDAQTWELGMICQLSIPIITICALMVLFVFLVLLNIVFFWLPFFRICLPIPIRAGR